MKSHMFISNSCFCTKSSQRQMYLLNHTQNEQNGIGGIIDSIFQKDIIFPLFMQNVSLRLQIILYIPLRLKIQLKSKHEIHLLKLPIHHCPSCIDSEPSLSLLYIIKIPPASQKRYETVWSFPVLIITYSSSDIMHSSITNVLFFIGLQNPDIHVNKPLSIYTLYPRISSLGDR